MQSRDGIDSQVEKMYASRAGECEGEGRGGGEGSAPRPSNTSDFQTGILVAIPLSVMALASAETS